MKQFQLVTLVFVLSILASCKKEKNNSDADVTIPGSWAGWWGNGSSSTKNNMTVVFRDNGTARVVYGYTSDTATAAYKLEGNYSVENNVLRFSYIEDAYTILHKANVAKNMSGTWGTAPSETDGGPFELSKK